VDSVAVRSEVPAVTGAKKGVIPTTHAQKSHVKPKSGFIPNVATGGSRLSASHRLKSQSLTVMLAAGKSSATQRLQLHSQAALSSRRTRIRSTSNTTRKKRFNSRKKTLHG